MLLLADEYMDLFDPPLLRCAAMKRQNKELQNELERYRAQMPQVQDRLVIIMVHLIEQFRAITCGILLFS